ncbi:acyl-CoA dehydrogenase family protein [Phenylobacterium sp. LH3H17]|uniref:acyl-CoA dehydrogenase family protein n=1 Tax=Phenylobacterium sp. LH3H17 TaxID=2903901 RepID=UPI0020C94916|nr:acyl-CoA dehydrogenase family protein [Phenylobacterium sp. LH3H17]UTP38284.1 acyl-CoA dehydrogenase family protein [Phenylobacterium sp. LH3H17]
MDFNLSPDQQRLQDQVAAFAASEIRPVAERLDAEGKVPLALFAKLADLGVTSIPFAPEWGGMGLGVFDMVLALEQIARADQSLAVTTMVSVATGLTLQRFGSEEQKARFLPDIVSGAKLCSIAGTEPNAGSDTSGFTTSAQLIDGQWRIDGEKAFITNPGTDISSFALVLAVTGQRDSGAKTFTLFLVPNGASGYTVGKAYDKLGWRSSDTRPLYFDGCEIAPSLVVGEAHQGRHILHKGYQQARLFLAASSLGLAQACLDESLAYAKQRRAFGVTLGGLQLVAQMVAEMALKVETARLLVYRAATLSDQGQASLKDLALAKWHATEVGNEAANLAIQVHGGWGFMQDCPVSRYLRDNRICTIGDGSSQIQQLIVARELGLEAAFGRRPIA